MLVIVPYDTVEEDVVVCTASDAGRVPTGHLSSHRGLDS